MKVFFIEESCKIGGVQSSTFFFSRWLKNLNYIYIKILLPSDGDFMELCKKNGLVYSNYRARFPKSSSLSFFNDRYRFPNLLSWIYNSFAIIDNIFKVRSKLKSDIPDIVITKGFYSHIYTSIACKSLDIKTICHLQDLITNRYKGILRYLFNIFLKIFFDFVVCDGQKIFDNLGGSLKKKSTIIPNGIVFDELKKSKTLGLRFRKKLNIPSDSYLIGNLSRFTPWKGQLELLEAFIDYSKSNKKSYLIIAGSPLFENDKYFNKIKKIILDNNIEKQVKMPGYIFNIKDYLSSLDLYVQPSKTKDTTPLSLLSSLAIGLPVIISKIESFDEMLKYLPYIDRFKISDKNELIKLLIKYEDQTIREKVGLNNRNNSFKFFDISVHGEAFLKIIKKLV